MWRWHVRKERFVTCVQKVSLGIHALLVKLHGSKLYGRFFPILYVTETERNLKKKCKIIKVAITNRGGNVWFCILNIYNLHNVSSRYIKLHKEKTLKKKLRNEEETFFKLRVYHLGLY